MEMHKKIQVTFELENAITTIVGFRSTKHRGIFTPGDSNIHIHFQTPDNTKSGHIQKLQFTYAERATDWRGNNNIAESIFNQMGGETHPVPRWVIMSAGTGGTAATLSRYIRYRNFDTGLCVVDVEHSAFFDAYQSGDRESRCSIGSRIEGVGRPRVEPSFVPEVIDCMIKNSRCRFDCRYACPLRSIVSPSWGLYWHQLLRPVLGSCQYDRGR